MASSAGEDRGLRVAVDSATEVLSVALLRGDARMGAAREDQRAGSQARRLLPLITGLLGEAGAGVADVRAWCVSLGPGSFTGIRIGVATVQALAWALGQPVVGGSTLDGLAWAAWRALQPAPGTLLVPLLDARKAEVYARAYRVAEGGDLQPLGAARLAVPALALRGLPEGPLWLLGRGLRRYADPIRDSLTARTARWLDKGYDWPDAAAMAAACDAWGSPPGEGPLDPLYLRRSEAEESWARAHAR